MKRILIQLSLWTCLASTASAIDFTPITSKRAFATFIAGQTLRDEFGGTLMFHANGAITGQRDSAAIKGGWAWREGQLCRRMVIASVDQGTECGAVFIRATQVVVDRGTYGQALSFDLLPAPPRVGQ